MYISQIMFRPAGVLQVTPLQASETNSNQQLVLLENWVTFILQYKSYKHLPRNQNVVKTYLKHYNSKYQSKNSADSYEQTVFICFL